MNPNPYHIPALLQETIDGLNIRKDGIYVDVTFGGGGHSRAILAELGHEGRLYGFDRDSDVFLNVPEDGRFTFVHSNFRYITNFLHFHGVEKVDGIVGDLGVSFHHFDDSSRGFSFRVDAPLDMRMNRSAGKTAADVVNTYSVEELENIFRMYTDLKRPKGLAEAIVRSRDIKPLETTFELRDAVLKVLDPRSGKKGSVLNPKSEKKDLAQVFQAFRIEVNGEMESLKRFLLSTPRILNRGGRLAVITYHSIEDRIVKNFMKTGNIEGKEEKDFFGRVSTPWKLVNRTPVVPSEDEVERNPRSRSAKLRIAEFLGEKPGMEMSIKG